MHSGVDTRNETCDHMNYEKQTNHQLERYYKYKSDAYKVARYVANFLLFGCLSQYYFTSFQPLAIGL